MTEEQIREIVREEIKKALNDLKTQAVTSLKAGWAEGRKALEKSVGQ